MLSVEELAVQKGNSTPARTIQQEHGLETNAYSDNEVIIMVPLNRKYVTWEQWFWSGTIPPAPGAFEILDTLPVSHLGNSTIGI